MKRREFIALSAAAAVASTQPWRAASAEADAAPSAQEIRPMDYPIIDTHVHFWDPDHLRYAWLDGSDLLNRPYLPEDYTEEIGEVNVGGIVFVQAECRRDQAVDEAKWVAELAQRDPRIQASVAWAPLELGEGVRPTLEALAAIGNVHGIRRLLQAEPDPAFMLTDAFVEGTRLLPEYGMTFDFGVNRFQLEACAQLAAKCPEVRFILDHIGVPDIAGEQMEPWRTHLRALAALPNVFCKMSGVATAADRENWTREDVQPYIETVIEAFGFDRLAFGSDWPVMLLATRIPQWFGVVREVVASCSDAERRKLFVDTAVDLYRLPSA